MAQDLIFHQLFDTESSTYTYILGDAETREALIIDPVLEKAERDANFLKELGLTLKFILDTHVHADHITGAAELRKRTGAKTCVSEAANISCVDMALKDGQELQCGRIKLKCLATPGHTDSCMSYLVGDRVFSGDALMIRACGRTDFQQGSPQRLYQSLTQKLFTLPPNTLVYPGHDYQGRDHSTIASEMRLNMRIGGDPNIKTEAQFVEIMNNLKLPPPKKLQEALPANLRCGQIS